MFTASAVLIAAVLAAVAAGLFPRVLPALPGSAHPGLDIYNAACAPRSLWIALGIYLFGMTLITLYLVRIYRVWRGKISSDAYHI
jgi:cytochrome bd-type quinol oxidase subunit 2